MLLTHMDQYASELVSQKGDGVNGHQRRKQSSMET